MLIGTLSSQWMPPASGRAWAAAGTASAAATDAVTARRLSQRRRSSSWLLDGEHLRVRRQGVGAVR